MKPAKEDDAVKAIERKLGYTFQDIDLLITALTHSSYANEHRCRSNERLEFLGDSVLGMIVAHHVFENYPDMPEGFLTKLRAELVCESSLWAVAQKLDFGSALRLGKGEENSGGRARHSILADCVEAVMAAMYLDGGFVPAKAFVDAYILTGLRERHPVVSSDFKTRLQELVQQKPGRVLSYVLQGESGPDHDKLFSSAALLNGSIIGEGTGRTKKEAEQNAAKCALEEMMK